MNERDNPFKLTPEENKAHFELEIMPKLTARSKAVEQPIFVLIRPCLSHKSTRDKECVNDKECVKWMKQKRKH